MEVNIWIFLNIIYNFTYIPPCLCLFYKQKETERFENLKIN